MARRNQHEWGFMGHDIDGWEYGYCELCKGWQRFNVYQLERIKASQVPKRLYQDFEGKTPMENYDEP